MPSTLAEAMAKLLENTSNEGLHLVKGILDFFSVQRLLAFARSFHTFSCMLHRTGKLTN